MNVLVTISTKQATVKHQTPVPELRHSRRNETWTSKNLRKVTYNNEGNLFSNARLAKSLIPGKNELFLEGPKLEVSLHSYVNYNNNNTIPDEQV